MTAAVLIGLSAGPVAGAQEPSPQPTSDAADVPATWSVGPTVPGQGATTRRPSRRATRIRVGYTVGACGSPRVLEPQVQRQRQRIVVTLTVHSDAFTGACPAYAVFRTIGVDLGGLLGRRAVFDGAPAPDERRIAVPPASR